MKHTLEKQAIPRLLNIIVALSVSCAVLGVFAISAGYLLTQKKVVGFAASNDGRVIPLIPLDQNYVTDARVSGFVDECLRKSFAHDFENYRITMSAAKECYTAVGGEKFEGAMSSLLKDIKERSLVMSVSLEPTVVTRVFKKDGIVHWNTQTMVVLNRRGSRDALAGMRFRVDSLVQRIPLDHHVRGISMLSINMAPS